MKKIIIGIIIVIIIGAGYLFLNKKPAPEAMFSDAPKTGELSNGTYIVAPETTVNWQANRPLMENYQDTGTLAITLGELTVIDGAITGELIFDMNSITAVTTGMGGGQEGLSKHLKSADFFDVEKYPTATFTLSEVIPTETAHTYTAQGTLTMKDTTETFSFPTVVYSTDNTLHIQGVAQIDRTLWNIQYGSEKFFGSLGDKMINDVFSVIIDITAQK